MAEQLPLPLPADASFARADLIADASNAQALAFLATPDAWPLRRLALHGAAGVGKTHMLRAFTPGWRLLAGPSLTMAEALAPPAPTALDEAEAAPEDALFHLINRCAEAGQPLLLAARTPPARWPTALPDLQSRLRATTALGIGPPGEALLEALLSKHLADRQLRMDPPARAFLLARLPRRAAAVAQAVARLDHASLAEGAALTRPFVARALADLLAPEESGDEGSVTAPILPSPPAPARG
jgi:chromosomal replication initiation ATPase DnaA